MAGVALIAVVLAFLLVRAPSTGTRPEIPPPPPPAPPAEIRRPPRETPSAAGDGLEQLPVVPGTVPAQLGDPTTPPDVRAAAGVSSDWGKVARRLTFGPDPLPEWTALAPETNALVERIRAFRADPASSTWTELVAQQTALIPRIRQASPDARITEALDAIEATLANPP
jgi:hypothetical protein